MRRAAWSVAGFRLTFQETVSVFAQRCDLAALETMQIQPSVPGTNRPSGVRRGAKITRTAMLVAMPISFSQRQQVICSF